MKSIIVLNKDQSVKVISESEYKYSKDIKYLLFPIDVYNANTFILVSPKKLMQFTKAEITVMMQYKWMSYSVNEMQTKNIVPITHKYTSLIDFISAIHSLNRLYFVNYVLSTSNDDPETTLSIDVLGINIKIYNKDGLGCDRTIDYFNEEYPKTPSEYDIEDNHINRIIDKLDFIYELKDDDLKHHKLLVIDSTNNMWDFRSDIHNEYMIYGMRLVHTSSIYFMNYNELSILDNIDDSISNQFIIEKKHIENKSKKEISSMTPNEIRDISFYDYYKYDMEHRFEYIIEFILYIQLIYSNIILIYNDFVFNGNDTKFDIITALELKNAYTKKLINMTFSSKGILSISDFFNKIILEWGE